VFTYLLIGLLVGAGIHVAAQSDRSVRRIGEIGLLWVLVGYCGWAMLVHSAEGLLQPMVVADFHGFPEGGIYQTFTSLALLAMAASAVLAPWYRGSYWIGPALSWAIYFGGATLVHLQEEAASGPIPARTVAAIFTTHGLIGVLLVVFLLMSGVLARKPLSSS
jgi:uncharacterized protein DUF6790